MSEKNLVEENTINANEVSYFFDTVAPKKASECLFNTCTKFYPDGAGGWVPVKRIVFDRLIYNPNKMELHKIREAEDIILPPIEISKNRNEGEAGAFWQKSYNRARQQCFDYLMCNSDLNTFVTFTVDPKKTDSFSYDEVVSKLSIWLANRVQRNGLKYILVPEKHKSGAIHFHGIMNREGLRLASSGFFKKGKYTLREEELSAKQREKAQEIFNVKDLSLGFSTALLIEGEDSQTKISKYIWKYMTKQEGQKIGGRFYLHGGDLAQPKLVFENSFFGESEGVLVSYGGTACKIETFSI